MLSVTLDTNCLIDLEQPSPNERALRKLIELAAAGRVEIRLPAVSASEVQSGGGSLDHFEAFEQRVRAAGLSGAKLIEPICYLGFSFWGRCLSSDATMVGLERRIHAALHPSIAFAYSDYCAQSGVNPGILPLDAKWRNAKCDALVAWSHIHHCGDLLVTSDRNFHKATKREALLALGARDIKRPHEAVALVENERSG